MPASAPPSDSLPNAAPSTAQQPAPLSTPPAQITQTMESIITTYITSTAQSTPNLPLHALREPHHTTALANQVAAALRADFTRTPPSLAVLRDRIAVYIEGHIRGAMDRAAMSSGAGAGVAVSAAAAVGVLAARSYAQFRQGNQEAETAAYQVRVDELEKEVARLKEDTDCKRELRRRLEEKNDVIAQRDERIADLEELAGIAERAEPGRQIVIQERKKVLSRATQTEEMMMSSSGLPRWSRTAAAQGLPTPNARLVRPVLRPWSTPHPAGQRPLMPPTAPSTPTGQPHRSPLVLTPQEAAVRDAYEEEVERNAARVQRGELTTDESVDEIYAKMSAKAKGKRKLCNFAAEEEKEEENTAGAPASPSPETRAPQAQLMDPPRHECEAAETRLDLDNVPRLEPAAKRARTVSGARTAGDETGVPAVPMSPVRRSSRLRSVSPDKGVSPVRRSSRVRKLGE